jgi:hypothetical protein
MTACSDQRPTAVNLKVAVRPGPTRVLVGSGATFLLALSFFTLVWLRWESVLKSYPLLVILFVFTMVIGPAFLFISIRRMTEIGLRKRLVFSALLSTTAVGLIVLTFLLRLRHLAGG